MSQTERKENTVCVSLNGVTLLMLRHLNQKHPVWAR